MLLTCLAVRAATASRARLASIKPSLVRARALIALQASMARSAHTVFVIQKPQRALRVAQASTRMKLGRHRASSVVQDIAALAVVSSIARPVRIKTQQAHRTVCHARKENTKIKKGNRSVKIARQAALRNWKLH